MKPEFRPELQLFSSHHEPYLIPADPIAGDLVQVTLRTARDAPIERVTVRVILNGIDHYLQAQRRRTGRRFAHYCAEFRLTQPATHYHFLVHLADGEVCYLTRAGASRIFPTDSYDFTIDSRLSVPDWVASARFYQIFPDRFYSGRADTGVASGELSRDRFESRAMSWDSEPLPYSEGGSLDFFNGDLAGIEQKLDYLAGLGINALYITPIFRALTNHRYDCIDYLSVDPHLGGDEALVSLVASAHRREMRVVLDVSLNHIGREHSWMDGINGEQVVLRNADGSHVRWAGVPELAKLDYRSQALREWVYRRPDSVVQRYLRPPFSIDGWRFDVASEVGQFETSQDGPLVWREIRSVIREVNPEAYIVGEYWHDSVEFLGSEGWDSAMNYYASGRPARLWMGERDRFVTSGGTELAQGSGISPHELRQLIEQHFLRVPSGTVDAQFNLLDSHDVPRLHNHAEVFSWELYAGVVALLYLLPGTFSLYYGDEVGIPGHGEGDHGKRFPMPWGTSRWDERFVMLYSRLSGLKRERKELHHGESSFLSTGEERLTYARFDSEGCAIVILNRSSTAVTHAEALSALGAVTVTSVECPGRGERVPWEQEADVLRLHLPAKTSAIVLGSIAPD